MTLIKINKDTLKPEPVNVVKRLAIYIGVTIIVAGIIFFQFGYYQGRQLLTGLTDEEKLIIVQEYNEFNELKLIAKLKELNVKFPYIVLAQAKLETGNFTSKIFKENNNLFGMREAKQRITTAQGTENNHAYYHSWQESVLDYAFYQCRYLSSISTEAQYFNYLKQSYAEDTSYVNRLQTIIDSQNLKNKFQ